MDDNERPAKRQKLSANANDDFDLLLNLSDEDWSNDLFDEPVYSPVLSAVVPAEEEDLMLQDSQATQFEGVADEELLLPASGIQATQDDLSQMDAPVADSQTVSQTDAMFTLPGNELQDNVPRLAASLSAQTEVASSQQSQPDEFDRLLSQNSEAISFDFAFKTAAGNKLAAPSEGALAKADKLLASPPLLGSQREDSPEPIIPQLSQSITRQSVTMPRLQPPLAAKVVPHPLSQVSNFSSPPVQPNTPRPSPFLKQAPKTAFQTPVATARPRLGSKPFNSVATPSPAAHRQSQSATQNSLFSPSTSQRSQGPTQKTQIDLRMSVMKSQNFSQRPKFVPPFKNGKQPSQTELEAIQKQIRSRMASQAEVVASQRGPKVAKKGGKWKPFFNLKGDCLLLREID